MTTYDVHTHIGIDSGFYLKGWWPYASTAQDLIGQMDAHGIDRACSFPLCLASAYDPYAFVNEDKVELLPGRVPYDRENKLLLDECDRLGEGRLDVLAMFDPSREVAAQIANLEPLVPRITGLKVQATIIQAFIPDLLDKGKDLMAFAAQHDLPVLFHTSYMKSDPWSQITDCLAVAEANPTVRFNFAHSLRFCREHMKTAAAMPNVWVDCSAHLAHCGGAAKNMKFIPPAAERPEADYNNPLDALQASYDILGDTYMWGSDNPFMSYCDENIKEIHTYKAEIDVIRAAPQAMQQSMLSDAPCAWLSRT